MPLSQYSVLKGSIVNRRRETGNTPHDQLHVVSDDAHFRVAVNVESSDDIGPTGWSLADRTKQKTKLGGTLRAGASIRVPVNDTLLEPSGLKVDGVSYTKQQASREGWTLVFAR